MSDSLASDPLVSESLGSQSLLWPFDPWWLALLWVFQIWTAAAYLRRIRGAPRRAARPILDGGFAAAWLLGALLLAQPGWLQPGARQVLDASGIPAALREVDIQIERVEQLPGVLWEALRGPFGWALDETPPIETLPLRGGRPVASRVEPALEALVVTWLRSVLYSGCAGILCIALVARRGVSLRQRVLLLEDRVGQLEARLEGADDPGFALPAAAGGPGGDPGSDAAL